MSCRKEGRAWQWKGMEREVMIHVGQMIKDEFDKHPKAHTARWLAGRLHCERANIYDIFNRRSVDTDLLLRISRILEHDFFLDISAELNREGMPGAE